MTEYVPPHSNLLELLINPYRSNKHSFFTLFFWQVLDAQDGVKVWDEDKKLARMISALKRDLQILYLELIPDFQDDLLIVVD